MWVKCAVSLILATVLWTVPGYAQWPERGLTLVSSPPRDLPWPEAEDPQFTILKELLPRVSRELGVPVRLAEESWGREILAANQVAGARPDGYVFGALGPNSALVWEIQGYTPYTRRELAPVATGWRLVYAIIVPADRAATDLRALGREAGTHRLASTGIAPVSIGTMMALEAARSAGFAWTLEEVERLDPELLLDGRADAMVLPLSHLKVYPKADQFKVLTVLSNAYAPCVGDWPTLESQGLEVMPNPLMIFYLPNKVNWHIQSRLSTAINNALREPAVLRRLDEACLIPSLVDLDGAVEAADREYEREAERLKALGFAESP